MNVRSFLVLLHDLAAVMLAWWLAYLLRFNFEIPAEYRQAMWQSAMVVLPVNALVFWLFGLYRGMWRFASLPDLKRILLAVGLGSLAAPMALYLIFHMAQVPRSVLVLTPVLLVLAMGGSRFLYRLGKDGHLLPLGEGSGRSGVLVLGAGSAAATLLRDLSFHPAWRVVGLLDDAPDKRGRMLHGVRVLGTLTEAGSIAKDMDVTQVIIAMPSASHGARRRAMELATSAGLSVLTVPSFDDLISGRVSISQIRKVELDDLLGRDPVNLDTEGLKGLLTGKVVMVTGAGGSIGSELCRQIAVFQPALLVLFEANELAIYNLEQEFQQHLPGLEFVCVVGDVKHRRRLDQVMERYRPAVVFHAAAYKHVPMMENENTWEAIQNNVRGTYEVARAAAAHGVQRFVFISTDKAVNPTNVMGASKRLAEMVCQAMQGTTTTRFQMVRFGNVLGSTGSVIPKFREQIASGGPVTVTHPDIIRYFMSIPEAAQLVLQAGAMGLGGEIFVLDMGEPVKILDLARDMIRLSGFTEDEIRIELTGLRPGEKLFEELLADDEHTLATPHPKLRVAKAREMDPDWLDELLPWLKQEHLPEDAEVRRDLRRWVPEYAPTTRPVLTVLRDTKGRAAP
ncbi:MAG: nucleoside-diphosphate sugar epimerase/dehydratase [Rhodocyclaceae bacterium]|nr:nucleoside-diphosphate sugar epimerase/dehydratase [Rhodocyclaceae bacterium]